MHIFLNKLDYCTRKILPFIVMVHLGMAQNTKELKTMAGEHLSEMKQLLYSTSDSIWEYAEPSFREYRTVELLKRRLRNQEFEIKDAAAGFETMFVASYGVEGPVIAILAEADADSPLKAIENIGLPNSDHGHSAGHHLLATASLGTVIALKELIRQGRLTAQLRYVFSTSEGGLGGRVPLVRDGYFTDVDLAFFYHPTPVTTASLSKWDAIIDLELVYPQGHHQDPNVQKLFDMLDAIKQQEGSELMLTSKITNTKFDLAIPKDSLKIHLRIEHTVQEKAMAIYHQILDELEDENSDNPIDAQVFRSVHEFIPNTAGNQLAYSNMIELKERKVSDPDRDLAMKIWKHAKKDEGQFLHEILPFNPTRAEGLYGYGSDIGDVSWYVPLISIVTSCFPRGVSMSNWEATAFGKSQYAKDGMMDAAKIMAYTTIDYLSNQEAQKQIQEEFEDRLRNRRYFDTVEIQYNDASRKKRTHY